MVLTLLPYFLLILSASYVLLLFGVALGHFRLSREVRLQQVPDPFPTSVSIVIAARNEEERIGLCLASILNQSPMSSGVTCEIIVVDDGSTDATVERVRTFGERVHLIHLEEGNGKRAALEKGIQHSTGEVILLTDADSIVPASWSEAILACFDDTTGFVAGPVIFDPEPAPTTIWGRFFAKMVALEWIGLMGISAGGIGIHTPINCSGANIAYRREAYDAIQGHHIMGGLSSGDDELVMQEIASKTKWKVRFALDDKAVVSTQAPNTVAKFLSQRKRWASKSGFYMRKWHVAMNVGIWLFFFSLFLSSIAAFWYPAVWPIVLGFVLLKAVAELSVLIPSTRFYGQPCLLWFYPLAFPFQVFYVIWAGAAGLMGNYEWKKRKIDR